MAKILVIDDLKSLRRLYKIDLESEGHAVVTARSAAEGLESVESESPDLVVWELGAPDRGGPEAMGTLRARHPETPVLLNTAFSSYRENLPGRAPDACIVKSSDTGELRAKVRELLDRRVAAVRLANRFH